jgi:hypothetical protein
MADFLYINTGTTANSGDGDSLRSAFTKINYNFQQINTGTFGTSTGFVTSSTIVDPTGIPVVDLKAFRGQFTVPNSVETALELFEFDVDEYRSASIDIFAHDQTRNTQDSGTGYMITWNGSNAAVIGQGIISLSANGTTGNASWDLGRAEIVDGMVKVTAFNSSNSVDNNIISWRAKVSLFRL